MELEMKRDYQMELIQLPSFLFLPFLLPNPATAHYNWNQNSFIN